MDLQATEITRQRYERTAHFYDLMQLLGERRTLPWRKRLWGRAKGPRILEVGVGTGRTSPFIRRMSKSLPST